MSLRPLPSGVRLALIETPDDQFAGLTYPRYRAVLSGAKLPEVRARRIAVGAWLDDVPVGLAYLSEPLQARPAAGEPEDAGEAAAAGTVRQLMSVMVLPFLRNTGIGRALLDAAAGHAAAAGTERLFALHSSQLAAREGYEALLRSAGWDAPVLSERRIVGKVAWVQASEAQWAPLQARWREQGFSTAPWSTVGAAEREEIAAVVRELPEEDRVFDPLPPHFLEQIDTELSLVLRRHGRIVGWLFGTPGVPPRSIWYSQGYVLPALQRQGWLLAGMRDVCERQLARMGPDSLCMFLTFGYNLAMQRVIERRFGPYADWVDSRYRTEKALRAVAQATSSAQPASDSASASTAAPARTRGFSQGVSGTSGSE